MALTFLCPQSCGLCGAGFEVTAGLHSIEVGGVPIPRVARRFILPTVCDNCWEDFECWRRKRLCHTRRELDKAGRNIVDAYWSSVSSERLYGRYREHMIALWLADCLAREAAFVSRRILHAQAQGYLARGAKEAMNHIQERRMMDHSGRYSREPSKTARRMTARHTPFGTPYHAELEACA